MKGVQKAIKIFGNQNRLAVSMGVSRQAVHGWVNDQSKISPANVLKLCEMSGWKINPHDLRPDIYPRDLAFKKV